ncbi:hypothetical protein [Streptomyces sp. NPDC051211]|uniref:hypothetical protein n=1 Tax=Streptomyces sp. NPDC051211 TaxID=3154643 RepID=UPI00344DE3B0
MLLGPGETADNLLTSRAFGGLAKLLEALRAHDTRVVEQLAEQQAPSSYKAAQARSLARGLSAGAVDRHDRRFYARGDMDAERVKQLKKLGMIWSHYDVAWEEDLAAARGIRRPDPPDASPR